VNDFAPLFAAFVQQVASAKTAADLQLIAMSSDPMFRALAPENRTADTEAHVKLTEIIRQRASVLRAGALAEASALDALAAEPPWRSPGWHR
jgi:hypothetical protein